MKFLLLLPLIFFLFGCFDTNQKEEINQLKNNISSLETKISSLESTVSKLESSISNLSNNSKKIISYQGILYSNNKVSDKDYWDISAPLISSTSITSIHVRQNQGFMWITPTYYIASSGSVRIIDDSKIEHGYEYRILVFND